MSTAMKKTKKNSGGSPSVVRDEVRIAELAKLSHLAYGKYRHEEAKKLGITVDLLDQLVKAKRATRAEDEQGLPHWKVEPWGEKIDGASLLDDIEKVFRRHIVLPEGAGVALALWVLHAWTFDAGDISPYLLLVSPEKRCGKTSVLILLSYLTPKAELASNISPSAVYRYVQDVRPTLLIDEADSFLKENEEMRGILNSGHTKVAANVLRNVERNGEHKTKRFSCWAPKAIAGIKALADTLEDRSIVVRLQRKTKAANVERLRRRDGDELALLRRRAARWADDNFSQLTDPDPDVPNALNDRAADNWRPLLAIADLAGGRWPQRARDAACVLSGEGRDMPSIGIELLADIREAFGRERDVLSSAELVEQLARDPERPWAEWDRGKPLTPRQLAGLLRPFSILSETIYRPRSPDAKGYRRARFEEAWEVYLPGQNPPPRAPRGFYPSKRRNADETGTTSVFSSVGNGLSDGSKNSNLSHSHADSDASTDKKGVDGGREGFDQKPTPPPASSRTNGGACGTCVRCHGPVDGRERLITVRGKKVSLHPECECFYRKEREPIGPVPQTVPANGVPLVPSGDVETAPFAFLARGAAGQCICPECSFPVFPEDIAIETRDGLFHFECDARRKARQDARLQ
jgi:putative DNA primase/helicase